MFSVRPAQIKVFEQASLQRFEDEMVDHARKYFPNHYRIAGEPAVRQLIRFGHQQSCGYLSDTEHDVALYVTVMFMIGSRFDSDFLFSWTHDILQKKGDTFKRAEELAQAVPNFQRKVAGEDNRELNRAFLTLKRDFSTLLGEPREGDLELHTLNQLAQLYPTRFHTFGQANMQRLFARCRKLAIGHPLQSNRAVVIIATLSSFVGSVKSRRTLPPLARGN